MWSCGSVNTPPPAVMIVAEPSLVDSTYPRTRARLPGTRLLLVHCTGELDGRVVDGDDLAGQPHPLVRGQGGPEEQQYDRGHREESGRVRAPRRRFRGAFDPMRLPPR